MTSLWQLKRFEARIPLFKSLDCPLALAAAGMNQHFIRYPPVINHNLGWCNLFNRNVYHSIFLFSYVTSHIFIGVDALFYCRFGLGRVQKTSHSSSRDHCPRSFCPSRIHTAFVTRLCEMFPNQTNVRWSWRSWKNNVGTSVPPCDCICKILCTCTFHIL